MVQNRDVNVSAQGDFTLGGRGLDRIEDVTYYPGKEKYALSIDTKRGSRSVLKLNMNDNTLCCTGDTRVPPFMKVELSANGAENLEQAIKNAFEFQEKDLR